MNDEQGGTQRRAIAERPLFVALLGYGGLLPFLALVVLLCLDRERASLWQGYLRAYAAVILSFVGALHWGFATVLSNVAVPKRNGMFAWSVVPCLMGFVALGMHSVLSEILLGAGFLLHLWQDFRLARIVALPSWYIPLRLRLSAIAMISLCVSGFVAVRLPGHILSTG